MIAPMADHATEIDTIRRAADLLYQRLEATTPGPWRGAPGGIYGAVISNAQPHDNGYGGQLIGESVRPGNREYLVTMQPAAAKRLADWLAACADLYDALSGPLPSAGVGPCCADRVMATIERYGEEEYIQGRCTPGMAFADWIRQVRAQTPGGNRVTIYGGFPHPFGGVR